MTKRGESDEDGARNTRGRRRRRSDFREEYYVSWALLINAIVFGT